MAIACEGVWKSYRIYHQRSHTLKEKLLTRRNRFEEFWALRGVDIEVPTGSTLGLIGSNGSGKSTLLKTMARILSPNKGTVKVNGTVSALLELGIGFHPELTGRENVYLGGSLLGLTRRDVDARYDDIVTFAGIPDFMDAPVKNYSSGMYARLAFAMAVSVDPDILIVDEVLSVGDQGFQLRCFERMAEFREQGRTVVIVSHNLETVRALCARTAWLADGVVREFGDSHDVANRYLADVHGAINDPDASGPHHRHGSGEAQITEVRFLDADGLSSTMFRTGEPMTVHVCYDASPAVTSAVCCIAVYRAEDFVYVVGQASKPRGVTFDLSGRGFIEFSIPQMPLLPGTYIVSVGLQDDAMKHNYDWHDRRYSFLVFPSRALPAESGIAHVEGEWRSGTSAAAQPAAAAGTASRPGGEQP
ncbi:MAG: ABC transporter ATP-binding protein [Actinomycetota bacterium]|nr:ABC transporter ATP-binding protein [Actinomycetota bacterium]